MFILLFLGHTSFFSLCSQKNLPPISEFCRSPFSLCSQNLPPLWFPEASSPSAPRTPPLWDPGALSPSPPRIPTPPVPGSSFSLCPPPTEHTHSGSRSSFSLSGSRELLLPLLPKPPLFRVQESLYPSAPKSLEEIKNLI